MPNNASQGQSSVFFPTDLILVGAVGLWAVVIASGEFREMAGREALGLLAVLFVPGYAAAAVLFPAKRPRSDTLDWIGDAPFAGDGNVTFIERLIIAVGLSVCLVPFIGIGLASSPLSLHASSFLGTIGMVSVVLTVAAVFRRAMVASEQRFNPSLIGFTLETLGRLKTIAITSKLTLLLIIGFVVAGSGLGIAVLETDQSEQYTEFYLTMEDSGTGADIADAYPDEILQGDTEEVHIGITNNEGERTTYTVVVLLQSLSEGGVVQEEEHLDSFSVTLDYRETYHEPHSIQPEMTGEDLRVTYLLYTDDQPEYVAPGTDSAYRYVHFWVDVPPSAS